MKRLAVVSVLALATSLIASGVFAQTKPTTGQPKPTTSQAKPTTGTSTSPPAVPGKWVPPVKGMATIDIMPVKSKVVGKDIVTEIKVKNTSSGAINLLRVDELWYNKKREMITSGTERYKKPLLPGEVVTLQIKSPLIGTPDIDQFTFSHANGKIEAKKVKKIE